MKTFLKIMVAAIVAMGMAFVLIKHNASDNVVLSVTLFGGIAMATLLGVFDSADKSARVKGRVKSEKFATAAKKNYGRAA